MTTATQSSTATQVYQLYIRAGQQQVWEAITDPAIVARFFHGARVESTYEVGTLIRQWSPDHSKIWTENTVLECDPPRKLVHTWRPAWEHLIRILRTLLFTSGTSPYSVSYPDIL